MKPSSRDYQLGLASPLNYAAIQSGNIKNSSHKEAGLDVSHHAWFPARGGERIFFLTSSLCYVDFAQLPKAPRVILPIPIFRELAGTGPALNMQLSSKGERLRWTHSSLPPVWSRSSR